MPTYFTMVASLSRSNCQLPAYRRMAQSPSHLPGSVPLEYLDFCVRGKFCHLAQGNKGLIVVKGSDQRKIFEKLGPFTINLEILPHFRDLNDRSLPDHLHDEFKVNLILPFLNSRFLRKMAKKWKKKMPANKHKRYAVKKPEELENILGNAENKNMDLSEICTVLDKKDMESLKSENTKVKDEGLPGESKMDITQWKHSKITLNKHTSMTVRDVTTVIDIGKSSVSRFLIMVSKKKKKI
ncbi:hypothetical protein TNCV_3225931 [Trichonephila clavipes]|nr:hypothetical protein TNCV_3225931 [Trichonephila clavipes]